MSIFDPNILIVQICMDKKKPQTQPHTLDGKTFRPDPNVVPFGVGKRRCLGEPLARVQLYRFVSGLAHRFRLLGRPGAEMDPRVPLGSTHVPPPYQVRFVPRQ